MKYIQKFEDEEEIDQITMELRKRTEAEFMKDPVGYELRDEILLA